MRDSATQRRKVLYIEDDAVSRRLVKRVLESEGYQVLEADDGLVGIDIAQQLLPDLILVDINLGSVTGHEVATKLKGLRQTRRIPIIALTAATVSGGRERALAAGCDGYIPKPIDIDLLPDQVQRFMSGARETVTDSVRSEKLTEYSRDLVDRLQDSIVELQKANDELRRLDKMKSDFVILASHELRTPLTLIYGYVNLMQMEVGQLPASEQLIDLMGRLSNATSRLTELYDAIINVSLIDTNHLDLTKTTVELLGVIASVMGEMTPVARRRNLRLAAADFHGLPPIQADPDYLRRAIANVVSNAVKYTPDGGAIDITFERQQDSIDIIVVDTGIGIDKDEHDRIFQKFVVVEDIMQHSTSKSAFLGGGMGLGLSVVRGIVEGHGGRVWVESEGRDPDRLPGTRFHILLPMTQPDAAYAPPALPESEGGVPS
jgi:signal transduction histidine kinase